MTDQPSPSGARSQGLIGAITAAFVDSKLVPIIILIALLLGVLAVLITPSEEEPQITVPLIDVLVQMPGASPKEIESRVINPMERLLWEIPGVEYVYSTALDGQAITIVRFYVGEETEKSLLKTYDKLYQHLDWIPAGCSTPLLKPRSIDDVPMMTLTFWGDRYDSSSLRHLAAQVNDEVRNIPGIAETTLKGGLRREVRVLLDPEKLSSRGLDPVDVVENLTAQNTSQVVGDFDASDYSFKVRLGNFFHELADVQSLVLKVDNGKPVYLRDVADLQDGPEEPVNYVFYADGPAGKGEPGKLHPAVSLSIAKRKGENATALANQVERKVEALRGYLIPDDAQVSVTRNYGATAKEKSDELLQHLFLATIAVGILIGLFLGLRASLIVMISVPVTLAITLFIYYFFGYTLNRVTLFALIFCIGILVDDPIVDVENIIRHLQLPESRNKSFIAIIIAAVNEVRAPLILATFTVVAAIMPMAFVRGLMGPYMRPMPVGASVAMMFSMLVAFIITPWSANHILRHVEHHPHEGSEDLLTRFYRWLMGHLIRSPWWRWVFLGFVLALFLGAVSLFVFHKVYVKMLPFDNKSEFQVILNMPEGSTLETTARVAEEMGQQLLTVPEVTNYQLYIGTSAPFNFNGLVRHYYQREGPDVADLQVNLAPKGERQRQSHDIVKGIRPALTEIAKRYNARLAVSEVPPGPPVLQTLVAEVYGPDYEGQIAMARRIREVFQQTPNVVDVDWYMTEPQTEYRVVEERDKELLNGVPSGRVEELLKTVLQGTAAGLLHDPRAQEDVNLLVQFPRERRSSVPDLLSLRIKNTDGRLVSLAEVAQIEEVTVPHPIYHKNLHPVVYVTGDMAGEEESPIYGIFSINKGLSKLTSPGGHSPVLYWTHLPFSQQEWAVKWDGEWQVTFEVFRDLGLAFVLVMILIYMLVVGSFKSYTAPLAITAPIPLSLIGILPAHYLMGAFFTATSMIGFIAGAGIVVRNSIILADFIELRLAEGMPLAEAVIDAGAVRFRPMLLTALAVVVGSLVILFDPIFQGLAISLMAGEVAATLFSRMVVPILYYLDHRHREKTHHQDTKDTKEIPEETPGF